MDITRRDWLGLASAAGTALAAPAAARTKRTGSPGKYGRAIDRIRAFAAAELADKGFPGMTLALVGPGGFATVLPVGYANAERRIPVAPEHLFQIGSISKSLVAMCLFALADKGKVDLDARVQSLLPEHPLPPEPITVTQLLDHSSGLPNGAPPFPDVPGGRLWTGFTPGSRYSYCNLGYELVGAIIERASGMTCGRAVETLVLQPLGMTRAEPVIRIADRARYATGYRRLREDLPWLPGAPLAPAQWVDSDEPQGSAAATSADMTRYMTYLMALDRGKGAPLFSDSLAQRFRTPTIDAPTYGPGARYGNGLITLNGDGGRRMAHTGGMLAFTSTVMVDPEVGVGCFASVNVGGAGNYRPREVTEYACAVLKVASEGGPLPDAKPKAPPPVKDAARFTGRWISADAGELLIVERAGALFVTRGGRERPLRSVAETGFVTDDPSLPPGRLNFVDVPQPLLIVGDSLFGRDQAPPKPPVSARLTKLAGRYYNPASWDSWFTVYAVGDKLLLGSGPLTEAGDGSWRSANAPSERLWFENPVDGRPQQVNLSGIVYRRAHDRTL